MLIAGEGLGSGKSGRADPVMAGDVKRNNLGVGAARPDEVTPEDDIYEQYKKRMMLGYRYRPNPLVCFISFCGIIFNLIFGQSYFPKRKMLELCSVCS